MQLGQLKPGKTIDIIINREGYNYRVVSKIEDVGEGVLYISLITSKGRIFMFRPTDKVQFVYKTEERLWAWKNVTGDFGELDGARVHRLFASGEPSSFNRRNAYRVFMSHELFVKRYVLKEGMSVSADEDFDLDVTKDSRYEAYPFKCKMKNISESGVGIFSNEMLQVEDEFLIDIASPYGVMNCTAVVRRVVEESEGDYHHFFGCEFTRTDKRLPKYLFELQREQLKKANKG